MGVLCVGVPLLLWSAMRCALSYYGIIIAYSYLLVKRFCEIFSRFSTTLPISLSLVVPVVVCTRGGLRCAQRAGVSAVTTLEK